MRTRSLSLALLVVASTAAAAQQPRVVAQMRGLRMSVEDFSRTLVGMRGGDYTTTLRTLTPQGQREILDGLVDDRLFAQAARDDGFDRDPAVAFDVEQAAAAVLAQRYRAALQARLAPTDAEIRAYYAAHPSEFVSAKRVKASHVLVATEAEALEVRAAIAAGAAFGDIARTTSIDTQTRLTGGALNWIQRGVMSKSFEDAVFALPVGALSVPLKSPFGFHIVRVEAIDVPQAPPLDAVADRVRTVMIDERLAQQRATLAQRYEARVHQDVLDTLSRPSSR